MRISAITPWMYRHRFSPMRSNASDGTFLRDIMKNNSSQKNFRIFALTKLHRIVGTICLRKRHGVDGKDFAWRYRFIPRWSGDGNSERTHLPGWLEGYLLTGRHGFFSCYEAFIHLIDSMFNQHAKWLKPVIVFRGADRWHRWTICWPRTFGDKITMVFHTKIPVLSITL